MALTESPPFELTEEHVRRFQADGFVIVDRIIDPSLATSVLARYEELFAGHFETGLYPDEWNWRTGRDTPDLTRQICNAWKSDRGIAQVVLRADIGRAVCPIGRVARDPVEPGQRACGSPPAESPGVSPGLELRAVGRPAGLGELLDRARRHHGAGGTVEYVRGSHRWQPWGMIAEFHGPDDPHLDLREAAAAAGVQPEFVPVEVPAGGGAFHAGWTWHGSGVNHASVADAFARGPLHVVRGALSS